MEKQRIGILISGRGSNMVNLIDATRDGRLDAEVALVISNIDSAPGIALARERGVETIFMNHRGRSRELHDNEMAAELKKRAVSIVCLAGYMRLVSPAFIRQFENCVLNIHPSLLPAFPGLDAQRQALEQGVKVTGCTVHLIDEQLDHGPIVMQRAVDVRDDDSVESLAARILEQEHRVYPEAVGRVLSDRFRIEGCRTYLVEGPKESANNANPR
ncbi:MAG TPA: phosphoribosylglycinamide formyltransferase [Blastocatellia bacterium]|jgi:phosphoribosylglycinamide formyltransferase-1|nr:phosphoribosylglycinamide formyltransferase [Blastocatellia bacterium]